MKQAFNYLSLLLGTLFLAFACSSGSNNKELNSNTGIETLKEKYNFGEVKDLGLWTADKQKIKATIVSLLGDSVIPPAGLPSRLIKKEKRDGYTLETIELDNGLGYKIPAYFLIPEQKKDKYPAILYMHYHGAEYENGKEELFSGWPGKENIGERFVKEGYIVMAIDVYAFGKRQGQGPGSETGLGEEMNFFKYFLWKGRTLWGMIVRDDMIALNYLCSRSEVDTTRIGCTGMSMGSTRAWWLSALDTRIKSTVGVACFTRYNDLIGSRKLSAHSIYYFLPGFLKYFDSEAVVALIPPRKFLNLVGDSDEGSPVEGVKKLDSVLTNIYNLYREPENYRNIIYPGIKHQYTPEMYHEMLQWFKQSL